MSMKKYFIILIVISAILGCNKSSFSPDLNGTNTIQGKIVLYDTLSGNYNYKIMSSIPVYLRYLSDTAGFLYSTITNGLGQFTFNGIDSTMSYIVFANVDSLQIQYSGQITYPAGSSKYYFSDTLKLYPSQLNQNGIFYQLQDSLGGALANCNLYIFRSRELWTNNDSLGSDYVLKSDAFGRCFQLNVSPGQYYVHAIGVFNNITLENSSTNDPFDSIYINQNGILPHSLVLYPDGMTGNELNITTVDKYGDIIPDVRVILFTSQIAALADTNYESTASFDTLITNQLGKGVISKLPVGTMYIDARVQLADSSYLKLFNYSINIPTTGIQLDTLTLE